MGFVCESRRGDSYFFVQSLDWISGFCVWIPEGRFLLHCTKAWLDQWVLCVNPGGEILTSLYRGLTGSMGFVCESRRGDSYFIVQRLDWINWFCVWILEGRFLLHCTEAWLDQWVLCLNPGGEVLTSLCRGLTGSVSFVFESRRVDSYFIVQRLRWVFGVNLGIIFHISPQKHNVVMLMSTHNIHFYEELMKLIRQLLSDTHLFSSMDQCSRNSEF